MNRIVACIASLHSSNPITTGYEDSLIPQITAETMTEMKKYVSIKRLKSPAVTKYAKAGDYKAIKEPSLASKLLADFTDKYINKGDSK